ncbi:MAG: winged helix-turn-helix domain-containing tetratricopeptide repeat protein [Burkholderiales bacterium]
MHDAKVFRFGSFRLLPGRRELLLRGDPVTLGSRAYDLLVALVNRQGQLVTKDALMDEVWPGTVVDENNLPAQISVLRKLLAADESLARCLQTVAGRGYRFVANVEVEPVANVGAGIPAAPNTAADALSIVVLPFANLSSDVEQAYFAQGMSDTVTTDLSRISGLLVISASTAATFEGKAVDVRQVSRELGVRFVLKGSVQRNDRNVRINAQLIDGPSGVQIWSEILDGDSADLFALQDRITGRIAISIGRAIFVAAARDGEARNIDPKSSDLVMRGIVADNKPHTLEGLQLQEHLFARAVQLDPKNGDALARLARAILIQSSQAYVPAQFKEDALRRGAEAAEKALALDPGNPRAHLAMTYLHVLRGDFERGVLASERAIALDRNLAMAHNMLATSLLHLGKGSEAIPEAETAVRLDPIGPQIDVFRTTMGLVRLLLGQIDEAIDCFTRSRAGNPKLARAHAGAAIALAIKGDVPGAQVAAADLLRLAPDFRLSQTIDACLPTSPPRYRQFFEEVLRPGAVLAGVPV